MERTRIERINELSRKSKTVGLNEEEKKEQLELRQEYIREFRKDLESTLDSVIITDKEGNRTKIKKKSPESPNYPKLQ